MEGTASLVLTGVAMLLIAYVVALRISITRLQKKCSRLASERRGAEQYLEDIGAMIVVLDTKGSIERLNKKCLRTLGTSMADVAGKNWYDIFVRDADRERIRARFLSLMSGAEGEEGNAEYSVFTPSGREIHTVWYRRVLRDESGDVSGLLSAGFDITDRKEQERALEETALRDELTGLYNLRGYKEIASRAIGIAHRTDHRAFVFFADVDNLKDINDEHGHSAGDEALRETARCLMQTFRSSDVVGRVGGDEFAALAIIRKGETPDQIEQRLSNRLDEACREGELPAALGLSVGVAEVLPENPDALEIALAAADRSMYGKKRSGRENG